MIVNIGGELRDLYRVVTFRKSGYTGNIIIYISYTTGGIYATQGVAVPSTVGCSQNKLNEISNAHRN